MGVNNKFLFEIVRGAQFFITAVTAEVVLFFVDPFLIGFLSILSEIFIQWLPVASLTRYLD